ncbi:hypothetical protein quinque_005287 [Culex quinquefasciatus]
MNLYTGQPESDDSCVATDLEQRYKMFLAEGFTPAEAAREAKEIIKFEWLVDQGRDQDQAALLVQMPLRSLMMTTFSQKPADLGYPARVQWLLDRGLYTYEEATVFAFQKFDILVVMHDEVELAAGRQHRIQDYFSGNRRNVQVKRKSTFHPQFGESFGAPVAKVAAVRPTFRDMVSPEIASEIAFFRSQPVLTLPFPNSGNLDRLLKAPSPKPEEAPPVAIAVPEPEPTPSSSKAPAKKEVIVPVVAKTKKAAPTAKPVFKWSWKEARANLGAVPAGFGQDDEEAASVSAVTAPEVPKADQASPVPDIPKALDPALLTQPVFAWACPIVVPPTVVEKATVVTPQVEVFAEPPPLPPEQPKPPEPEPEPVFKIATITTGPTKPPADPTKYSWVNPAISGEPKAEEAPRPIPSLAAVPDNSSKNAPKSATVAANLKWSSTIPTINTRAGNNIVITPTPADDNLKWNLPATLATPEEPKTSDEFSLSWDKAWGEATSSGGTSRWANFKPVEGVEEDPDNPYGVPLLNRQTSPTNKVEDLYAMLNRFDGK